MAVTIGIDVGGTKIAAGVVDDAGKVIARRQIATAAMHPTAVVAGIVKVAQELNAAAPGATGIGIGAAGLIDGQNGVVLSAPNIALANVPLRQMVADRIDLPVVIDNDANVAAWGEALYGAGKGYADQIMLTVGTGIGGGIILDDKYGLFRFVHLPLPEPVNKQSRRPNRSGLAGRFESEPGGSHDREHLGPAPRHRDCR